MTRYLENIFIETNKGHCIKNENIEQNRNEQKIVRKDRRESYRYLGAIDLEWSVLRPILGELKDLLSKRKNVLKLQITLYPQWKNINLHSTSQQNIQSKTIFFLFQISIELIVDKFFLFSQGVCTESKQQKKSIRYIKHKSPYHHEKSLKMNSTHQELTGNWVLYIWSSLNKCDCRFKPLCCGPCSGGSLGTPSNFCREAASTPRVGQPSCATRGSKGPSGPLLQLLPLPYQLAH